MYFYFNLEHKEDIEKLPINTWLMHIKRSKIFCQNAVDMQLKENLNLEECKYIQSYLTAESILLQKNLLFI
jgi:hypothetical protein